MFVRIIAAAAIVVLVAGSAVYFTSKAAEERKQARAEEAPVRFDLPDAEEMGPQVTADDIDTMIAETPAAIATIDGEPVSSDEYLRALKGLAANVKTHAGGGVPQEAFDNIRKNVLDTVINNALLAKVAAEKKIAVDAAEVEATFARMRKNFPDEESFAEAMAAQGITEDELKADMTSKLTIRKLIDREVMDTIVISDAEAKTYYDTNRQQFERSETVHAAHILVRTEPDADEAAWAAALAKAEAIVADVRAGGDFAKLAKEKSEDPGSAGQGGDLGEFPRGRMVKEFEDAAFAAAVGDVTDPVKTQFGYHVIRVADKKAASMVPFKEAKDQIAQQLKMQQAQKTFQQYLSDLRAARNVVVTLL
jgi:peptidyl-prolyl cis-trans isomerase C